MSRATFNTTLMWHDSRGGEVEADVRVLYSFIKGYPDTLEEPGSPDEIEIISITPASSLIEVPEDFYTSAELLAECAEDHAAEVEDAQEWRAQCRRDDMLMGGDL